MAHMMANTAQNHDSMRELHASANHPTVDLPAMLEGPRLPTAYRPGACEFAALGDCSGPSNGRECWAHRDRHESTLRLLAQDGAQA